MKSFAVQVEEGKEGKDGKPSLGPVYRNLLSKNGFPPVDAGLSTSWDLYRYRLSSVFLLCELNLIM